MLNIKNSSRVEILPAFRMGAFPGRGYLENDDVTGQFGTVEAVNGNFADVELDSGFGGGINIHVERLRLL